MSTEIKTIKGTYHYHPSRGTFEVKHEDAELHLTRFWNGNEKGRNIQITILQQSFNGTASYIHLNEKQCNELGKILLECFDDEKYPSE